MLLLFTTTLFALTTLASVPLNPVSTHQAQLTPNSSLVGAFDTSDGFGFATIDANKNLSVYNSYGIPVTKKPLQTTEVKEEFFGLWKETLTLRAPVKAYGERVVYMLVDNRTLVDRDPKSEASAPQRYKLDGAYGFAFDVDDNHIAYLKGKKHIVILDKKNLKRTIATIPVRLGDNKEPIEVRNLELEGTKLAITYRGHYQVVDFTNAGTLITEIDVNVPLISTQLVTANEGKNLYHATLDPDGQCKAYSGSVELFGRRRDTGKETYTYKVAAEYEIETKSGKEAIVAINGRLREVMLVRVEEGRAKVERFKL